MVPAVAFGAAQRRNGAPHQSNDDFRHAKYHYESLSKSLKDGTPWYRRPYRDRYLAWVVSPDDRGCADPVQTQRGPGGRSGAKNGNYGCLASITIIVPMV